MELEGRKGKREILMGKRGLEKHQCEYKLEEAERKVVGEKMT